MWIELAQKYTPNCIFSPPAPEALFARLEEALGVALPGSLRGLLSETNGLNIRPSFVEWVEPDDCTRFIYSAEQIVETNLWLRSIELKEEVAPLHSMLFFADEPNGDFLGFPVAAGRVDDSAVVSMSHENFAERRVVAGSLQELLTVFLSHVQRLEVGADST
jgi:hypothetical protein